ncbi:MAG TPA: O-antigen ligase family protein [Gaiellaceae bacterium]|nr:O-antigen ligase family protein [Gaiellaceae bacterium]
MRATRELPLAAAILLAGLALFFGGGPGDGSIPWLGGGVLLALLACLALQSVPRGSLAVLPLVALAVWCAVSIDWSWLPDRSWNYANRALVYALFAALGLFVAGRTRGLANGLAAVLGAVIAWSLLGKVLPPVYDYGSPFVPARLQGPIGLWNQLALAADYALVLALWRRGRSGTLLAYLALVALMLTYSRGGILTAVVAGGAWLLLGGAWLESAATLLAAILPAGAVVGIAFALPGVTSPAQTSHVRWHDGLVFGAAILVGAAVSLALERLRRPRDTAALRRSALATAGLALAAGIAVLVVRGIGSGTVTNGGGHVLSTSSNFRFTWWHQAWRGFEHHVLLGTGAGSFHLVNLLYRTTYLDETTEPHDLPLQFLQETGLVGLVLLVVAMAALLRWSWRRRGHELALALLLPAFLVHALVDVDWDFLAVAAPAFLAAGALAGRPAERRGSAFALLPALGVAALAFAVLLLPWLGARWADEAYFSTSANTASIDRLANRAHSVDPLLLEPYWAHASAADQRRQHSLAFAWYVQAVKRQPHNPETWNAAGEYAFGLHCYGRAYTYLEKYTELNQKAQPSQGGDDYNTALKKVNAGAYSC